MSWLTIFALMLIIFFNRCHRAARSPRGDRRSAEPGRALRD